MLGSNALHVAPTANLWNPKVVDLDAGDKSATNSNGSDSM